MSVNWSNINQTFGAMRNAQLAPLHFPEWTLRIYAEQPSPHTQRDAGKIVRKLHDLGADVFYVDARAAGSIPPSMWSHLAADDPEVEVFIVRSAHGRLSGRDALAVGGWLKSGTAFHCVRDHPVHSRMPLVGHLWGARSNMLAQYLNTSMASFLQGVVARHGDGDAINPCTSVMPRSKTQINRTVKQSDGGCDVYVHKALWDRVGHAAYCHDSVSCDKYPNTHSLPKLSPDGEYIGRPFDAHGTMLNVTSPHPDTKRQPNCTADDLGDRKPS